MFYISVIEPQVFGGILITYIITSRLKGILIMQVFNKAMSVFKDYFKTNISVGGINNIETEINNGYCYVISYILKRLGDRLNYKCDIVRSYSHWFFRVYSEKDNTWVYYDAWTPEGTLSVFDITDNLPEDLEVWSIARVLSELDKEKTLRISSRVKTKALINL